ncbi:MAG TPA: MerR family transcriptional regulator [Vicinamibacteria bacterium]|nr:MerR family transcriptional regulator [Vicinamibacteria bacterium]
MTTGMRRAGEVARLAGVSTDTIRHYERRGLLPRVRRSANGYREYPAGTEQTVRLIRNALTVGFTLEELARVLAARARGEVPCRTVRALAGEKLRTMDDRLAELQGARDRLQAVLADWDARLLRTPAGQRAGLLEALAGLVEEGAPPPFLPPELRRGRVRARR